MKRRLNIVRARQALPLEPAAPKPGSICTECGKKVLRNPPRLQGPFHICSTCGHCYSLNKRTRELFDGVSRSWDRAKRRMLVEQYPMRDFARVIGDFQYALDVRFRDTCPVCGLAPIPPHRHPCAEEWLRTHARPTSPRTARTALGSHDVATAYRAGGIDAVRALIGAGRASRHVHRTLTWVAQTCASPQGYSDSPYGGLDPEPLRALAREYEVGT